MNAYRIESLLAARLFLAPKLYGDDLYFVSNLSGHLSLYRMKVGGSLPEPLLPPNIVLQNPHLMARYLYALFPKLGKILVMLDDNGDENYQPMLIPIDGGLPEPAFDNYFAPFRCHCLVCDPEQNILYLTTESREDATCGAYQCNLENGEIIHLYGSEWGAYVDAASADHTQAVILDNYTVGDTTLTLWDHGQARLLYGAYLEDRAEGQVVPLSGIGGSQFVTGASSLLMMTTLFEDTVGLGLLDLNGGDMQPVTITGVVHSGMGELDHLTHLTGSRYAVGYNIDGCSWLYDGTFAPASRTMALGQVICGTGEIANGVLEAHAYDPDSDRHILTYSTATSPTQIYLVTDGQVQPQTHERILGISEALLSSGEDASFVSHDGLRTSARLYLPADSLGYAPPYPLVYYVHGGPQSQERPDFAWFSMPLIQFLTLNGLAVFVPNVRGSTGYGLAYTKHVDRDWGGQDRLDHVYAMKLLGDDPRVDTKRAGVVGRSYGGYMTLTLAFRHPELWQGAVDMFGPNDLLTFMDRIPETWKPYFKIAVGDLVEDHDFLVERSPRTYMQQLQAPMLVIQGQNDPRVIERESRDVVEQLRAAGKSVDYLLFPDEGHDVLKYDNRVRCYNAITDFFKAHL